MNQTYEKIKPEKKKSKGNVKVVESDRSESTSIKSHHKIDDKMSKVKRFLTFGPKKASLTLPELPRSQSLVEAEKKSGTFLEPEHSKSLLSVPTVSKDDLDSLSYKSTVGDSSEESDDDDDMDIYGSTNIEAETVTMVMQKILALMQFYQMVLLLHLPLLYLQWCYMKHNHLLNKHTNQSLGH